MILDLHSYILFRNDEIAAEREAYGRRQIVVTERVSSCYFLFFSFIHLQVITPLTCESFVKIDGVGDTSCLY